MMTVRIKLFASLRNYVCTNNQGMVEKEDAIGKSLKHLIEELNIDMKEIGFASKNGTIISKMSLMNEDHILMDGDYIELYTMMKGG